LAISGVPRQTKVASVISTVPPPARPSATQPQARPRRRDCRLHSAPAIALNHTSTDRSTCTTSTVRKKSPAGSQAPTPGVRASTSSSDSTPEASSAASPSASQPRASAAASLDTAGSGSV
jgi:hypothetical protein